MDLDDAARGSGVKKKGVNELRYTDAIIVHDRESAYCADIYTLTLLKTPVERTLACLYSNSVYAAADQFVPTFGFQVMAVFDLNIELMIDIHIIMRKS